MGASTEVLKSIDRALEIIEILYMENREMRISDIAKRLNVYQSTVYRALVTLQNRGFVYQNSETNKYGLGMKLYAIGISIGNKIPLIETIKPYAKELSDELQETINVCVLDKSYDINHNCLLIHQETVKGRILGSSQIVGSSSESYCSAAGKILLAFSNNVSDEQLKNIKYKKYTNNTISSWKELSTNLEQIKRNRYALDNEEREEGTFCVACPIFGKDNEVLASLSVSGPSSRLLHIGVEEIVERLNKQISQIEKLLN